MEMLCGGEFVLLVINERLPGSWQDDYSLYFYDIF